MGVLTGVLGGDQGGPGDLGGDQGHLGSWVGTGERRVLAGLTGEMMGSLGVRDGGPYRGPGGDQGGPGDMAPAVATPTSLLGSLGR